MFLIIRENRTYDQVLGDVPAGNGEPSLAVFGGNITPNAHELVKRFPLLDNFYDPSRQSADGHQWIIEGMAPYADDIQSPDWVRSYPGGNGGVQTWRKLRVPVRWGAAGREHRKTGYPVIFVGQGPAQASGEISWLPLPTEGLFRA